MYTTIQFPDGAEFNVSAITAQMAMDDGLAIDVGLAPQLRRKNLGNSRYPLTNDELIKAFTCWDANGLSFIRSRIERIEQIVSILKANLEGNFFRTVTTLNSITKELITLHTSDDNVDELRNALVELMIEACSESEKQEVIRWIDGALSDSCHHLYHTEEEFTDQQERYADYDEYRDDVNATYLAGVRV